MWIPRPLARILRPLVDAVLPAITVSGSILLMQEQREARRARRNLAAT